MALNMGGRGIGFELGVNDTATPVLNTFMGTLQKSPSQVSPLLGALGRLGGRFGSMAGGAASATSAVGGLAASLGPLAIAIGVVVLALLQFNEMATAAEQTILSSIDTYASYEQNLAEVGTILGGTADQMDAVGESARKMSAQFGVDVQTQLKATYQAMSAGFADAAEGAALMTTANKLAVAGVTDVFQSVDLLTTVLNGYGIEAQNSIQASDALFQAVKLGKTRVDLLSSAMGQVVPSASAAGLSLDETAGAMATLTLAGQSTRMSSVALGRAMDFLAKMPPKLKKGLDDLGIDSDKLNVKTHGLQNVLMTLGDVLKTNEKALFDLGAPIRAFRALMPLATTMSGKFAEVMTEMANKQGATQEAFERMTNTIEFQRKRWAAFKETLFIELGQVFAPVMKSLLNVLESFIVLVNAMPGPLKKVLLAFVGLGLALPVVGKHSFDFLFTLGKLVIAGGLLTTILITLGPALLAVGVALAPLLAMAGALALAWETNFLGIRDVVVDTWGKIKMTFKAVAAFIRGGGVISGPLAEELAKPEFRRVRVWAATIFQLFDRIKAVGVAAWKSIRAALDAVAPVLRELHPSFASIVDSFFATGAASVDLEKKLPIEKFIALGESIGDAISAVIRFGVGIAQVWRVHIQPTIDAIIMGFRVVNAIATIVGVGLGIVFSPLVPVLERVAQLLNEIATAAGRVGGDLGSIIAPIIESIMVPLAGEQGVAPLAGINVPAPSPATAAAEPTKEGAGAGRKEQISINVKNEMQVDGDTLGQKINKFVVDLASREMIQEPTA